MFFHSGRKHDKSQILTHPIIQLFNYNEAPEITTFYTN